MSPLWRRARYDATQKFALFFREKTSTWLTLLLAYSLRGSSLDIKIPLLFAVAITVLVIVGWLLDPWRMGTESLSL